MISQAHMLHILAPTCGMWFTCIDHPCTEGVPRFVKNLYCYVQVCGCTIAVRTSQPKQYQGHLAKLFTFLIAQHLGWGLTAFERVCCVGKGEFMEQWLACTCVCASKGVGAAQWPCLTV